MSAAERRAHQGLTTLQQLAHHLKHDRSTDGTLDAAGDFGAATILWLSKFRDRPTKYSHGKSLFRHCSTSITPPERFHVLTDCAVLFSQRQVLRDPQEFKPEIEGFGPLDEIRTLMATDPFFQQYYSE
jgi:hypothetical protein